MLLWSGQLLGHVFLVARNKQASHHAWGECGALSRFQTRPAASIFRHTTRSAASTLRRKHRQTQTHTHVQLQACSDASTFSCKTFGHKHACKFRRKHVHMHVQTQARSVLHVVPLDVSTSIFFYSVVSTSILFLQRRAHVVQCCMLCLSTQARSDARSDASTFSAACCASRCRHLGPEIGCRRTSGPMAVASLIWHCLPFSNLCLSLETLLSFNNLFDLGDVPYPLFRFPLLRGNRMLAWFRASILYNVFLVSMRLHLLPRVSHAPPSCATCCLSQCASVLFLQRREHLHLVQRAPQYFTTCFSCTSIMCNVLLVSMRLHLVFTTS